MAILECDKVYKSYGDSEKPVLNGISFSLDEGCFVSIMGRSGSGKSTLLKILCGLLSPDSGSVTVCGKDVHSLDARAQSVFRHSTIGIVFQSSNLVSDFCVTDNILTPLYLAAKGIDKAHFDQVVALTELGDHLKKYPHQLSGGQRQRVAVARAVIAKPKILFADEPTGSLDSLSEENLMRLFASLNREFGTTIVQVTHAKRCADASQRVIRIDDGKVTEA